jgi:hypothetical protein
VTLLLLVLATVLLVKGIGKFRKAEADLKRAQVALDGYYAHDPFPSRENVGLERTNVETLREWFGRIRGAVRQGQIEEVQKSPSTFMTMLSEKQNALVLRARTVRTALPENFAFGFDRYSAQGVLPAPGDVPRLTQQLVIVERLCEVLLSENVHSVETVGRAIFEQGAEGAVAGAPGVEEGGGGAGTAAPARGRVRRPPRRPGGAPGQAAGRPGPAVKTEDLYVKQHFVLEFTAKESSLMGVLNRLASDAMFAVVTGVQVGKKSDDVVLPSLSVEDTPAAVVEETGGAVGAVTGAVDAVAGTAAPAGEAPSRRDRIVSGPEKEVPLKTRIELDVYRFKGE